MLIANRNNKHLMTGPEEKCSASGNKINCFLRDRSLSDCYTAENFEAGNSLNLGGRRSTFGGNSELLPSDVIDFAM